MLYKTYFPAQNFNHFSEMVSSIYQMKKCLLLRRLGIAECERLIGFIHPRSERVLSLRELFGEKWFELRKCFKCLTFSKSMMKTVYLFEFSDLLPFRTIVSNVYYFCIAFEKSFNLIFVVEPSE